MWSFSNIRTPITIPIESIKSEGFIDHRSLNHDKIDLLEKTLDDIIIKTQAKGISATVAVPGKGVWYASRGVTGNNSIEKITPDLMFFAGSIGKIFTAVIILKLIEEGQLSLENPVVKWFPGIDQAGKITINHLLTHTSGIVSFDNLKENEYNKFHYHKPEEILFSLRNKKLLFEPGKHYAYSNTGYLMLGIVIEQITGKPYQEAVQEYIINRINLCGTDVLTIRTLNQLIVRGHHHGNVLAKTENFANPFAAGAIIATPKDLVIFFKALMNGKLLSQDSVQKMFSDMIPITGPQGSNSYYGNGIVAALWDSYWRYNWTYRWYERVQGSAILSPKTKHICLCHDE